MKISKEWLAEYYVKEGIILLNPKGWEDYYHTYAKEMITEEKFKSKLNKSLYYEEDRSTDYSR